MQTVIQVVCKGAESLRAIIASDEKLGDHRLQVIHSKRQHRSPGWAKVTSTEREPGAINFAWSVSSHTLNVRVVTKRKKPFRIVGDFVAYLLARHSRRIVAVLISRVT
ncbi:MAG: hypothetical protein IMZ62_10710 [Chloroflexi bacterium]|nr:hypothetical protein [Chloroflexota bacterium]